MSVTISSRQSFSDKFPDRRLWELIFSPVHVYVCVFFIGFTESETSIFNIPQWKNKFLNVSATNIIHQYFTCILYPKNREINYYYSFCANMIGMHYSMQILFIIHHSKALWINSIMQCLRHGKHAGQLIALSHSCSPSMILVRKDLVFARLEGSLIDDTKSSSGSYCAGYCSFPLACLSVLPVRQVFAFLLLPLHTDI